MSMTFAEAAELVLRDAQRAMKPEELWAEIERRKLVETGGRTPLATLKVELARKAANSSLGRGEVARFYRNGDGAFGLWADLSRVQQDAMLASGAQGKALSARDFPRDAASARLDPAIARQVLAALVPGEAPRRATAAVLAELIARAAAVTPHDWKLTIHPGNLALNVGRFILAALDPRGLWITADLGALTDDQRATFEGLSEVDPLNTYLHLPGPTYHWVAYDAVADLADVIVTAVAATYVPAIAAGRMRNSHTHAPGAVTALAEMTGRTLPLPEPRAAADASVGAADAHGGDEDLSLADLVAEYLDTYAVSDEGREFLTRYESERIAARAVWERIATLEAQGQDVTDVVLEGVLPHQGTAKHLARGAWVSHAPVILGEVRTYFERAKWVTPESWPAVAQTVLRFLRGCLDAPDQLAAHIASFVRDPLSKGFSVGTLTPFLSAMAPDRYPLVNKKVLQVVNYFQRRELEPTLPEYPAAIEAIHELVREQPGFSDPRLGGVRAADTFDHFCHWIVAIRKFSFPELEAPTTAQQTYWKISPGEVARLWERWRTNEIAEIGWNALGDLSEVREEHEFRARVAEANAGGKDYKLAGARQAWNLARLPVGTLLVANRGTSEVVGLGRVKGPYRYEEGAELAHQVPVDWFDVKVRAIDQPGWIKTLMELDRATYEELASRDGTIVDPVVDDDAPPPPPPPPPPAYTREQFIEDTGFDEGTAAQWLRILQDKKQIIIQGPPGTGKTYVAERLARLLTRGISGRADLVQFHPAYSYEDFIQGLRPQRVAGGLDYVLAPGRFMAFCERARAVAPDYMVLIIDEINRANLPRVFGELMYLLEYRDAQVPLASGGTLSIPGNVRIIGTMNTADRSIARLDHALRRRFSFLRLPPKLDVLEEKCELDEEVVPALVAVLREINAAIADPNFELGISYFLRPNIENTLDDVWEGEIEPYLEEYFYDQPRVVEPFRWRTLSKGKLAGWSREG